MVTVPESPDRRAKHAGHAKRHVARHVEPDNAETQDYQAFLARKRLLLPSTGRQVEPEAIHARLFPFQRDLVRWALRKGRAAIFADTGLGKTGMQVEWARLTGERTLLVAPLSVARQTVAEAALLGVTVTAVRDPASVDMARAGGIYITNYELIERFDASVFGAVVLDESSILKSLDGKTRAKLTEVFAATPYRLCCTATPAPNDISEIANHAEFLGVMSRAEMLAMFFVHDDAGWRLKGHAYAPFYRWLASWGMSIRKPSDLGYSDDGYELPPLTVTPHFLETDLAALGRMFYADLHGITDRLDARRASLDARVQFAAQLINDTPGQWIVWHGLNDEGRALHAAIPDSVLVEGSQKPEEKVAAIEAFQDGRVRVLITKAKIAGFGLNFQSCHQQVFVGLSDSWEAYYQCIRRSWRFGQTHPVNVRVVLSEAERQVFENVQRKEQEAMNMSEQLVSHVQEYERAELGEAASTWQYETQDVMTPDYHLMLGDSAERLRELADASVSLSVFSPPFQSLYTYSPTERDLGNCRTTDEFAVHFRFIIDELLRVTMPGRIACCHVAQVPAMLARDGYIGMKDFRGDTIRAFQAAGWIYHGEVCIDKDPQAQAIRTKSKGLLFVQVHKDASWSRPALADYILLFRKPGDNAVPITPDISNEEWIEWARPIWYGIRESDTLNVAEGREADDERHIAPLQLGTIERCVRLWSNPGELVLSPFLGIGSEGYVAIKQGRRFVGCELKPSYFSAACKNLKRASGQRGAATLWSMADAAATESAGE